MTDMLPSPAVLPVACRAARRVASCCTLLAASLSLPALATDVVNTQQRSTGAANSRAGAAVSNSAQGANSQAATKPGTGLDPTNARIARMWEITDEEMVRALWLLRGPTGAFGAANLSPVEALGLNARNEAERRRYAELFAKFHVDSVERMRAWSTITAQQIEARVKGAPVIAYDPAVAESIDPAIGQMFGVPRFTPRTDKQGAAKP